MSDSSEADRISYRKQMQTAMRGNPETGAELTLLVWKMSGDLPVDDLVDIYKEEKERAANGQPPNESNH